MVQKLKADRTKSPRGAAEGRHDSGCLVELAGVVESFVGVEFARRAIATAGFVATVFACGAGRRPGPAVQRLPPQTLALLREQRPAQFIYISGHPATLARDLNILCRDGVFGVARVMPLDMFPQTQHVECVADVRAGVG